MRRLLLATLFLASPALADPDTTPPDFVITATRIPTLIERIPAGVTVIDRATIENTGAASLSDVLNTVPGLHIVPSGGMGGNASVFIRGTNSDHVLVLRDGIPINDPSDPGGLFNFGVDGLADIERIEVIRGPMSSLYGSGAIGGVINLITKHGSGAPTASIDAAYGLPRSVRLGAGLSGSQGKFDYAVHFDDRADVGFDSVPQRMSVYTGGRQGFASQSGSAEFGYTPIDGTRLFVALNARTSTFNLTDVGFPIYNSQSYIGHDQTISGRTGITSHLFDGVWETSLVLSQLSTDRHYLQPFEAADPNNTTSDTKYHGARTSIASNNTIHLPDTGPANDSALLLGAEHHDDTSRSTLNLTSFGLPYSNSVRASAGTDSGHAGLQTTLAKRLTLTADARAEAGRYGGAAGTWRTGAVFALPEMLSRLKASYGTAFRAPSLFDLFGVDSAGYVGNPNLKPERSAGWEAGFATDLPALGRPKFATVELTLFANRINNLIQTVYNSTYTASTQQNVARATASGYEASLTLRPTAWLNTTAAWTHTDTRNVTSGATLLRRPCDQASITLRASPVERLTLAASLAYTGPFQDYLYDNNGFPLGNGHAQPGSIVNATVNYDVTEKITAYLSGSNLSGSRFEPANGYQTPGTSFLAGMRAKF